MPFVVKNQPLYLTISLVSFAQFLSIFRLLVIGLMLLMMFFKLGIFGLFAPKFFISISIIYAIFSITIFVVRKQEKITATEQLANSLLDITFLVTLTGLSGGMQTGLAILTLIVMGVGAGLCSKTGWKLLVLWSILATVASEYIRIEYFHKLLAGSYEEYLPSFFIGIAYVVTGVVANYLGFRLRQSDEENAVHQKKMDLQLKINELMLREMEEGVIIVDSNGDFVQINRHTKIILMAEDDVKNFNLRELSSRLHSHFISWKEGGVDDCEFRLAQNSSLFKARFVKLPKSEGISVIFIEDLENVRRQAQRMKMSALGLLTANIAHEIRNPLSAIHQAAELLQSESDEGSDEQNEDDNDVSLNNAMGREGQNQLIEIILQHSGRIDKIIRDVGELGRRDRVQKEKFSPLTTISEIVNNFLLVKSNADDVNYSLTVFTIAGDEKVFIEFDVSHFHQIINNLINNAWQFCKKEVGSIRVNIGFNYLQQKVSISVIDDGVGIRDDNAVKIFEPFFTTRSSGTGIGLFVSRELCEANNGALNLQNNAPGAFFEITAPGVKYN